MIKLLYLLVATQLVTSFNYLNYQSVIECNSKSHIETPENLEELQGIINSAIKSQTTVKVIGSLHSSTDVICTQGIPIHLKNFNNVEVNKEDMTATIGAGLELQDALDILHNSGVTINHVPSFGGISIGGSIGLGAHGSSLKHPNTLSEYIVGLKFIDGSGNLREIKKGDNDFDAFRVNFGLLGIIVDATIKVVPSYKLKIHNYKVDDNLIINRSSELIQKAKNNDWFQFWWLPTSKGLVISEGNKVSLETKGNARTLMSPSNPSFVNTMNSYVVEFLQFTNSTFLMNQIQKDTENSLYKATLSKEKIFVDDDDKFANPAIGYSHNLMANKCKSCTWGDGKENFLMMPNDYAIAFPLSKFGAVVADMNEVFKKYPTPFPWFGLFFRLSTPSKGIMSLANGEEHFHIEWVSMLRKNQFEDAPFGLSISQSLFQLFINKHGGRPHWGKSGLTFLTHNIIRSRYDLEKFQKAMQKYDPNGLFLNKFGKRLLGSGADTYDIPSKANRCAIQNYCICKNDSDCPKKHKCGSLIGYNVCY